MTTHRPNVAIYQEFKTVSFTPATPTLHTLIVGPCYQILDYLDDKTDCYTDSDYGELEHNCPVTTTPAVIITDPPSDTPGAVLDPDSVSIFFDEGHAIVSTWTGAPDDSVYHSGDNLFAGGAVHFGVAEVQAGDRLIANPTVGVTDDYTLTVKELAYTVSVAAVTFITSGVTAGDTLTISNDAATPARNGTYTVKRVLTETTLEVEDTTTLVGDTGGAHTADVIVMSAAGVVKVTTTGAVTEDWCFLRVTTDFTANHNALTPKWRVERAFSNVELISTDYTVDNSTLITTIKAGVTVDLGTTLLAACAVTYAKIYMEYRALRRDLQEINEVSQDTTAMELLLGKLDARNPLHVGAYVAALNTLTTVKVFGLVSNDITGYMDFVSKISNERNIYAVVPLTYDTTVLGFLNTMAITLADPDYVLNNGIRQKFRAVLGAIELPTMEYVIAATGGATTTQVAGTAPLTKGRRTLTYGKTLGGTTPLFITTHGVIPGDKAVFVDSGTTYTYTIAHVKGEAILEVDPDGTELEVAYTPGAADTFAITNPGGTVNRFGPIAFNVGVLEFSLTPSALDDLFLTLTVPGATFVTSGVLPGDILQMPHDPMHDVFTLTDSWVVDDVLSETRLKVMNLGTDTPSTQNELPHQGWRGGTGGPVAGEAVSQGAMYIRVIRYYTKAQQITEMLATAHSFSSKRLVLCYPYQVEVAGLKDGSLDRHGLTDPHDALPDQPGYYLACAVGGQTAGQPSQQGFTFLGINGIRTVIGSNDYFSEEQLTELSNGGVYVFTQESAAALPSTIHEVTTDVSTVEFSEYMVLKNFDYIAWTFLDVLLEFIGKWNVTLETLQFIAQAEQACITTLTSARKPKIGAPLIAGTIISNEVSDLSSDRVESYIEVQLPMTLNIIGCHLVA
jgi:hypothetical protein